MKILQVIHDFLPRHTAGAEIYTYKLSKELAKQHQVFLCFTEFNANRPLYTIKEGIYDGLPYFEINNDHAYASFAETYHNPEMETIFARILDQIQPDIIHLQHLLNHSINYIKIAKVRHIPVVFTLHEYWLTCPRWGQRIRANDRVCHTIDVDVCTWCMLEGAIKFPRPNHLLSRLINRSAAASGDLIQERKRARIKTQNKKFVYPATFKLNGITKQVLVAHPPTRLIYKLKVPRAATLNFAIGMHPKTFAQPGDGVNFKVVINDKEGFSRFINPQKNGDDRRWQDHTLSLREFRGQIVTLEFITTPGPSGKNDYCTAGWADLQIKQDEGVIPSNLFIGTGFFHRVGEMFSRFETGWMKSQIEQRVNHVKEVANEVDLFIAPSKYLRQKFIEFGVPPERIVYSDYGFDPKPFIGKTKKFTGKLRFGFIGTLNTHKGVHIMVQAFNKIAPDKAELKIYGDLKWFPQYVARLKQHRQNSSIHFMGRFDSQNVAGVLSEIDVLIVPSIWFENSPLTIHEAFLAQTPVIASNFGGMAELVTNEVNGLLFEVGSPIDLAAKINRLINEEGLLTRLQAGIPTVKTIEQNASEIEGWYNQLVSQQAVGHVETNRSGEDNWLAVPAEETKPEESVKASIVIPTYNAASFLPEVLGAIYAQETNFSFEVIIIDSGSTDGTLSIAQEYPVRLYQIAPTEFNHGLTRNKGITLAEGELVVLLVQDAIPANKHWLKALLAPFSEDELVAGVFARQIPRPEADVLTKRHLNTWLTARSEREIKQITLRDEYERMLPMEQYKFCYFDDVCACVRKSIWEQIPYDWAIFGEDLDWAKKVLEAGYKIVYEPQAAVIHSHNRSSIYEYKRTYTCHRRLNQLFGLRSVPTLKHVGWFTLKNIQENIRYVWQTEPSLQKRISQIVRIPIHSLLTVYAQYKGAKDQLTGKELKHLKGV